MAGTPQYIGTVQSPTAALSVANPNLNGITGTYVTLLTAGSAGSRVDNINLTATATTTAGMVRLFVGTALVKEIPVLANTPSSSNPAFSTQICFENGLVLGAGVILKASTEKSEAFNLTVTNGGNF